MQLAIAAIEASPAYEPGHCLILLARSHIHVKDIETRRSHEIATCCGQSHDAQLGPERMSTL
jgi:hypothetical protein